MELKNAFQLDLTRIKLRLVHKMKLSELKADEMIYEYKCFLELMRLFPETIFSPSPEVDEVWHAHILHTLLYTNQCHELFGRFMHHNPTTILDTGSKNNKEADNYCQTLAHYKTAFGRDPPSHIWPVFQTRQTDGCEGCSVVVEQSNVTIPSCCSECSVVVL